MRPTQLLKFVNLDGLNIDRSHSTFHVQQNGADVLRGSGNIRWCFEEDEIVFLDQISGSEITRWKTPEGYFTEVRILSPNHFNILVTPPTGSDYLKPVPFSVSVFKDGQWSDIKFEDVSVKNLGLSTLEPRAPARCAVGRRRQASLSSFEACVPFNRSLTW
ncbi:hypothetical protein E9230_000249 [Corynebacterium glutamicum]|nr:hypothetical protein [Corynebacterium glutamicum]